MSLATTTVPIHVVQGRGTGAKNMGDIRSYVSDVLREHGITLQDSIPDHEDGTRYEIHASIVSANAYGVKCVDPDFCHVLAGICNAATNRGLVSVRGDFDISLDHKRVEVKIYL